MYICRVENHTKTMLYKFYPKFKCQYNEDSLLVYGGFYQEKPCWHLVRSSDEWRLDALTVIDKNADNEDIIYRVKGRDGNKTRFTARKIRQKATIWDGETTFMAIREDLIP